MMESFKKTFFNIKSDRKYYLYSPISETTMANLDVDSSGSEYSPPKPNHLSNYSPSDPTKLINGPTPLNQPNTNNDHDNSNANQDINTNQVTSNGSPIENSANKPLPNIPTTPKSPQTNNDNDNDNDSTNNKNTNIAFSTLSEMYKSKLLPWYLKKKRQTSFSNTDIKQFYNYNKCSNYEKYENYFSRNKSTADQYNDILLDKNAIELKELQTHANTTSEKHTTEINSPENSSGKNECIGNKVEEEIAQAMNGIILDEVNNPTNPNNSPSKDMTNNVLEGDVEEFSNTTILSPSSNMDTDQFIENNVTFEFQQDNTYPVVSTNVYPPTTFDLKNNNNKNEISSLPPQYPVLSSIENYSSEEFII